ncbi:MAG: LacI family DNA-binding transcriptional regulator [Tetrasphaera sp.]|jgi:LacI family repressor for deo operon, udp, cdd, tsx, nupC, and nupG|nr:LacI family DNA-binding transcriptional regulator [Tetrasphaera sp.]
MTTIADVAALAGVSVATVSRTLHGSARVDPRTREKVRAAAAALNYVASPTAMSLASGRTNVVAVVAPLMSRWFFATIVVTIEQELRKQGYHALLIILEGEGEDSGMRMEMFAKRVDGILSLNVRPSPAELAMLERLRLPIVAVGMPLGRWPRVHIDDAAAVRSAVEHLVSLGHRDIGYVGTSDISYAHMSTPSVRVEAFHAAIDESGLTPHPEWAIASEWTADAAARRVEQILRAEHRPTAILAASDEMAVGVIGAARWIGLEIPDDVSVMGIDDHTFAAVLGLTTIHQDVRAQGRAAVALLVSAMRGETPTTPDVEIPTYLIARETTAPLAPTDAT